MKTMLIAALLALGGPAPAEVPLQPTGKWTVEYADAACILSRDYGDGQARRTLGFKPWPLGDALEIVTLSSGATTTRARSLKAQLLLQPSGQAIDSTVSVYDVKARNQIVTTLRTEQDGAAAVQTSSALTIASADGARTSFAVPGMKSAAAALRACQDDLLKQWGVDPSERDKAPLPTPLTPMAGWITTDDYPSEALSAGSAGTTMMIWAIQPDGKVGDCRIIQSSGSKSLDLASCAAVTKRGRYAPPLGYDGKPTTVHAMRYVNWRLP
ncbi:energy transducer TonB [Sphingomonas sp. PWP1-2]|uniref:energy transducer TonB n=1 Tax=Sphingomonas sp. PWP1-2 TaxID=2804558 RepID=UPI003CE6C3C0